MHAAKDKWRYEGPAAKPLRGPTIGYQDCEEYFALSGSHLEGPFCRHEFDGESFQDAAKASAKERRSLTFQEDPSGSQTEGEEKIRSSVKRKLPRRHTGYAFDHPGFESFHANEVKRQACSCGKKR